MCAETSAFAASMRRLRSSSPTSRRGSSLRHVVDDLYQMAKVVEGADGWHEAVRVYVLLNDGCPLLFDSGSHIATAARSWPN